MCPVVQEDRQWGLEEEREWASRQHGRRETELHQWPDGVEAARDGAGRCAWAGARRGEVRGTQHEWTARIQTV